MINANQPTQRNLKPEKGKLEYSDVFLMNSKYSPEGSLVSV